MTFQGFVPPVDDYFRMPNEWINICAEIKSLAELKIVQYVLRHTWGYQDYDGVRKLTLDEFMYGRKRRDGTRIDKGTGLSDRGVKDGIALAMEHGYLICEVDDKDRARIKKSYGIKMISELPDRKILPPDKKSDRKNSPIPDRKILPPDRKNSPIKQEESSQRSEKETKERNLKKDREKDSVTSTSTQKPQPPSQLDASSPSLSQKSKIDYSLFDRLCHEKGYAADFKVPRNDKNNIAIQELRSQGATPEQVEYVFNDLWEDRDPFWKQHRGKPSTIASQFTARVWKMTAPAAKRQTLTGTPNYTEDRIGQPAQDAKPVPPIHIVKTTQPTYRPKLDQTPTYTRLKIDKPTRPRSLQARLQQQAREE
jgi:hypothetical protein